MIVRRFLRSEYRIVVCLVIFSVNLSHCGSVSGWVLKAILQQELKYDSRSFSLTRGFSLARRLTGTPQLLEAMIRWLAETSPLHNSNDQTASQNGGGSYLMKRRYRNGQTVMGRAKRPLTIMYIGADEHHPKTTLVQGISCPAGSGRSRRVRTNRVLNQ